MFTRKLLFPMDSFTRKRKLFFDETFWYVHGKPYFWKQKLSYLKNNDAPWFFGRVNWNYCNHTSHLNKFFPGRCLLMSIQAETYLLVIISFSFLTWLYKSRIHLECKVFKSDNLIIYYYYYYYHHYYYYYYYYT